MAAADAPDLPVRQPRLPYPLQEGETVVGFRRRHWLSLYPRLAALILLTVAGPVAAAVLTLRLDLPRTAELAAWAVAALWAAYWGFRAVLAKYRYDNDLWVVTNQRLIDSTKRHWFDLRVSTADLVDVEDMSIQRSGVLATLLDYGDIVCQTAGTVQNFAIRGIPDPRGFHALVDRTRDRARLSARET
ncbi:MAG TPA: hypothetical protein VIO14_02795 [Dehalococcoidia bacterium]